MDNIYCYKGSNVLKNKYDIYDKEVLDELEGESSNTKILSLEVRPNQIISGLSIKHLQDIHHFLFSNLYEWAGQFRKVDIMKSERVLSGASVEYSTYKNIEVDLSSFFEEVQLYDWNTKESAIQSTFQFLLRTWEIHPFREGNTRACTTFIKRILSEKSIEFNSKLLKDNPSYVRDSLVMATYNEPKYLLQILKDAFANENNAYQFSIAYVQTEYQVSKDQYYTVKQANELIHKKKKSTK